MTRVKQVSIALSVGLIQAAFVYVLCTSIDTARVWPGTILVFVLGVLTILTFTDVKR
jgi:hypothetical protein